MRTDEKESTTDGSASDHSHEATAGPSTSDRSAAPPSRRDTERAERSSADDGNQPPRPPRKSPPRKVWYRRPALVGGLILIVIVATVGGALAWRHSRTYVSTDDAFIDIVAQRVSPQIAGRVARVLVDDNQDVTAGTILVELDPAEFQNQLDQARARMAQAEAQIAKAEAQRVVAEARREQAKATESVVESGANTAADDLKRISTLHAETNSAVSEQQFTHAGADAKSASAQLAAARKAVTAADAELGYAAKQVEAAQAAAKTASSQIAQAELTLSYAQVKANVDGRVARKVVAVGNLVQPGSDLMAIVPRDVYVTANFKETQLAHLRAGQPVKIESDSYPDLKLTGRVASVQPATGSVFDQLPSQNAAGNWVKVVQRVPVKITLDRLPDDPALRLAPGMSVTATVTVR